MLTLPTPAPKPDVSAKLRKACSFHRGLSNCFNSLFHDSSPIIFTNTSRLCRHPPTLEGPPSRRSQYQKHHCRASYRPNNNFSQQLINNKPSNAAVATYPVLDVAKTKAQKDRTDKLKGQQRGKYLKDIT